MASDTREKLERLFPSRPSSSPAKTSNPKLEALKKVEREILGERLTEDAQLSVKERLERLISHTASRRPRVASTTPLRRPSRSLEDVVDGQEIENEHGTFFQTEQSFPLTHHHGQMCLERLTEVPSSAFSVLARGDVELDLKRALFLDTETTGLAGGSGTTAFLVGLGYIEGESFVVRQLFMRHFREERALLQGLLAFMVGFESLVSYNGKSYDLPLLETRFVLSRMPFTASEMPHFDLLHPARNLWKARFESCRLIELEYLLLRLERESDVPGRLIPELYFQFLRSGDASRLGPIFDHNRYDILSLAALTVEASAMLDEEHAPEDPLDDYSLGRLFERAEQPERSIKHYHRALEGGLGGAARRRSLMKLALQYKRRGELEDACVLWRELAEGEAEESILALVELAMASEHGERDFRAALEYCERALQKILEDHRLALAFRERWREGFVHRRRRLERRLERPALTSD